MLSSSPPMKNSVFFRILALIGFSATIFSKSGYCAPIYFNPHRISFSITHKVETYIPQIRSSLSLIQVFYNGLPFFRIGDTQVKDLAFLISEAKTHSVRIAMKDKSRIYWAKGKKIQGNFSITRIPLPKIESVSPLSIKILAASLIAINDIEYLINSKFEHPLIQLKNEAERLNRVLLIDMALLTPELTSRVEFDDVFQISDEEVSTELSPGAGAAAASVYDYASASAANAVQQIEDLKDGAQRSLQEYLPSSTQISTQVQRFVSNIRKEKID